MVDEDKGHREHVRQHDHERLAEDVPGVEAQHAARGRKYAGASRERFEHERDVGERDGRGDVAEQVDDGRAPRGVGGRVRVRGRDAELGEEDLAVRAGVRREEARDGHQDEREHAQVARRPAHAGWVLNRTCILLMLFVVELVKVVMSVCMYHSCAITLGATYAGTRHAAGVVCGVQEADRDALPEVQGGVLLLARMPEVGAQRTQIDVFWLSKPRLHNN